MAYRRQYRRPIHPVFGWLPYEHATYELLDAPALMQGALIWLTRI